MNSGERILAAIEHKESGGVPVDMGATPSSGISAIAYTKLKNHLWQKDLPTRIYDVVQQLAQPDEAILDRLGVDAVDVGRMFNDSQADWYEMTVADGSMAQYPVGFRPRKNADGSWTAHTADGLAIAKMPAGGVFYDQIYFPYLDGYPDKFETLPDAMSKVLWAAFVHSPWDHAGDDDFWETLRTKTLELRKNTDRALVIVCGCNLFEWGTFLRRIDNFLMDLYTEPDKVETLLDKLLEIHLATLAKVCQAVGDIVDIIRLGDDLGMDSGPFMSPEIYQKLFKPRHTQLCDYIHKNSSMHTFLHSCGSIYALLPDLIEAGFEIINPVQTVCKDMEPARLKQEFGKDIVFWGGGCDTRIVLNNGTPEQVRKHVLQNMEILAPGGGFVFNTVHNILPEVPPENILAAFDAVRQFNGGGDS